MLVVVDFGMGNLRSISSKLAKLGIQAMISCTPDKVLEAQQIILPGVGHFGAAMQRLEQFHLVEALNEAVLARGVPVLGICLGMQLFAEASQEGEAQGLGWIKGEVHRFDFSHLEQKLRVPHVGWNTLEVTRPGLLLEGVEPDQRFYFTHSYHMNCQLEDAMARTNYGYDFVSVVQHKNIFGVQFHPEKSHRRGIKIIQNFVENSLS